MKCKDCGHEYLLALASHASVAAFDWQSSRQLKIANP